MTAPTHACMSTEGSIADLVWLFKNILIVVLASPLEQPLAGRNGRYHR